MKPGRAFFIAALLWLVLGATAFFINALSLVWFLVGVMLLPVIVIDGLFLALFTDQLEVAREISASLALGEAGRVRLTVTRGAVKAVVPDTFGKVTSSAVSDISGKVASSVVSDTFGKAASSTVPDTFAKATSPVVSDTFRKAAFPTVSDTSGKAASSAVSDTFAKLLSHKFLPLYIAIFDLYPPSMTCDAFPATLDRAALKAHGTLVFEYSALPVERGVWSFAGTELLFASPLRFWALKVRHDCESTGRTYPNFKKIRENTFSGLRGLLEKTGLKEIRRRGEGMDFNSLREYQEGDSVKAIDWRATSRRGKVIIREYQEEQDQQVLLLLDSGYRLHRREGDGGAFDNTASYTTPLEFDSALNAAIFLAFVALKHGDSVALESFGNTEKRVPPRKGLSSAFPLLMNQVYDLKSAPVPSSPFSALESALSRLHRRTFIILISNFHEEDGESLSWILPRVKQRHLLLLVSLREPEVEQLAARTPHTRNEALETAAAFTYLASRRRLYQTWEHSGLLTLESTAGHLSSALINRYLEVKRSGRL